MKTCLLIIPKAFYSFTGFFQENLSNLGYDVVTSNDEYPANSIGKIMGKLRFPLLPVITRRVIYNQYVADKRYDLVLIFKGRGMSVKLIEELKKHSERVIGYNWDSFKINPAPRKWFFAVSKYFTFDYQDATENHLPVAELFSSMPPIAEAGKKTIFLSAIIKNHSTRLRYLDAILKRLPNENNYVYIYEQNLYSFLRNFLKEPWLYMKYRDYISFKSLPYKDYIQKITSSEFILDHADPNQTGITIRCFEALAVHTRIISSNPYLAKCGNFNETNSVLCTTETAADIVSLIKKCVEQKPIFPVRTIKDFLKDLIG